MGLSGFLWAGQVPHSGQLLVSSRPTAFYGAGGPDGGGTVQSALCTKGLHNPQGNLEGGKEADPASTLWGASGMMSQRPNYAV